MMRPHCEMANTLYHELLLDDTRLNQSGHHLHQHYCNLQFQQHPQHKQRQNKELCHEYEQVQIQNHQLRQHPLQFHASEQEKQEAGLPHYNMVIPSGHQLQEESTARASFWRAFNTVLSDAKGKQEQVNENQRCLVVSENNFGELEAVYVLARNKEPNQTGSGSGSGSGLAGGETESSDIAEKASNSIRRARKRVRKKEMEEELGLISGFFERLVKRVMNHQEVLNNKLLEVVERMEKEQAEREEGWRRQETEIYDRDAVGRAQERDLASIRESSIVSYVERITGQSFNNVASCRKNCQESTVTHEI